MKFSRLALILVAAPSLAFASCRGRQEETAERMEMATATELEAVTAAMDEVRTAFTEAFTAGDASKLAGLFADDAIRLAPNSPMVKGRTAIEEALKALFEETAARELTLNGVDRGASGDLAYEIGTYKLRLERTGEAPPVEDEGKYIVLLKRGADGTWKVQAEMFNSDLPAE
jgi:uncharacterized protein (TIGR02246 family)